MLARKRTTCPFRIAKYQPFRTRRTEPEATGHELRRMEDASWRVAVETTGGALERSAGRPAGPEVHEPGDCARENLEVSSPARANDAPESGRTEESLSGRVESSPGVCAVGPPGGSDEARDRRAHGLATAQRARLPVGGRAETRVQAALVLARRRAGVPAQRLSCSRKAW